MKKIFIFLILLFWLFINQNSFAAFSNLWNYYYLPGSSQWSKFFSHSYSYVVWWFYNNLQKYYIIVNPSSTSYNWYIKIIDYSNNLINSISLNKNDYSFLDSYNYLYRYQYYESSKYYIIMIYHKTYSWTPKNSFIFINKQNFKIWYSSQDPSQLYKFYVPFSINEDKFITYSNWTDTYFYDLTSTWFLLNSSFSGDLYKINWSNKLNFLSCDYSYILSNNKVLCSNWTDIIKRYYWDDQYNEFSEDYISWILPDNYFFKWYELLWDTAVYWINQEIYLYDSNLWTAVQNWTWFLNFIKWDISNGLKYYSIPWSLSGSYFDYQYLDNWNWFIELLAWLSLVNDTLRYSYFKFNSIFSDNIIKLDFLLEWLDVLTESNWELIIYESNQDLSSTWTTDNTTLDLSSIEDLKNNTFINSIKDLFNISLPDTPQLTLNLPIPYLTDTFWIGYREQNAELPLINDRLWKNFIEKSDNWSKLLSFIFAIFYIIVRVVIIFWVLYIFKLYHRIINKITEYLFWFSWWEKQLWNIVSLPLYFTYLVIVFWTFAILFTYIIWFFPIINILIDFINVLFSFIVASFFDYNLFKLIVNTTFTLFIAWFISYIAYILTLKFWRLN